MLRPISLSARPAMTGCCVAIEKNSVRDTTDGSPILLRTSVPNHGRSDLELVAPCTFQSALITPTPSGVSPRERPKAKSQFRAWKSASRLWASIPEQAQENQNPCPLQAQREAVQHQILERCHHSRE